MGTVKIPLHSRKYPNLFTLIDEEDAELVNQYRWHPDASRPEAIYARTNQPGQRGKLIKLHRLIVGAVPGEIVDHINRDTLDNRRENLRIVNKLQNNMNRVPYKGFTSRFKGVFWYTRKGRWCAQVKVDGKTRQRVFGSEIEAAIAYDAMAVRFFGEYCATNLSLGLLKPGDLEDDPAPAATEDEG